MRAPGVYLVNPNCTHTADNGWALMAVMVANANNVLQVWSGASTRTRKATGLPSTFGSWV